MVNKFPYTVAQRRALDTFVKLTRAMNAINSKTQRYTDAGLTTSQFGVLEALYHLGPLRQTDLAKKILKTTGNLTMVLDNLEKRKLILRIREQDDRRALQVKLTPSGHDLIASIFPAHADDMVAALSNLNADEQKLLSGLCIKLQ